MTLFASRQNNPIDQRFQPLLVVRRSVIELPLPLASLHARHTDIFSRADRADLVDSVPRHAEAEQRTVTTEQS